MYKQRGETYAILKKYCKRKFSVKPFSDFYNNYPKNIDFDYRNMKFYIDKEKTQ